MTLIEFRAKGGKPLFTHADAVHAWTESLENPEWTRIWIAGRQYEIEETVAEVTTKMAQS